MQTTIVHAQSVGDAVLIRRSELDKLLQLARQTAPVQLEMTEEGTTLAMMQLAERSGAFDFWRDEGEDIYSDQDGQPV